MKLLILACLAWVMFILALFPSPTASVTPSHHAIPLDSWRPIPSPAALADPSASALKWANSPTPTTTPVASRGAASVASMPASLSGQASWYCSRTSPCTKGYPGGDYAAAGPALRAFLGSGWRGSTVQVCRLSICIRVQLIDCLCSGSRLIDLYADAIVALGLRLSAGVYPVVVSW